MPQLKNFPGKTELGIHKGQQINHLESPSDGGMKKIRLVSL